MVESIRDRILGTQRNSYDVMAIYGNGFTPDWQLPEHVNLRLDQATVLFESGITQVIATCGKYSREAQKRGIIPPNGLTESRAMKSGFIDRGINGEAVLEEGDSMDVVSNTKRFRTNIMDKFGFSTALIVFADRAIDRVVLACEKVFPNIEAISFLPTETPHTNDPLMAKAEAGNLALLHRFLDPIEPGDLEAIEKSLYTHPFYNEWQDEVAEEVKIAAMHG